VSIIGETISDGEEISLDSSRGISFFGEGSISEGTGREGDGDEGRRAVSFAGVLAGLPFIRF
jgi:hypothetical protein